MMKSLMEGFFKPARPKITTQDKAILDLKIQRDKLRQYQKKLKVIADNEVAKARVALAKGDKRRALLALKMKRYQENMIEKTDAQLLNLEELTSSIEYALVEKQVLEGLKAGNEVLKEIHKEMSIESVEKLMEETAEGIAYQNEIEEILSSKISHEDEEEILQELEELEKQAILDEIPSAIQVPLPASGIREDELSIDLPEVPNTEPVQPKKERIKKAREEAVPA